MGVYVVYKIKELEFWYNSSYLDKEFAGLFFTDLDLIINENVKYDEDEEDENPHSEYIYKTTVKKAIDRLDAIGITEDAFHKEFDRKMLECIDYDSFLHQIDDAMSNFITNFVVRFPGVSLRSTLGYSDGPLRRLFIIHYSLFIVD